jgi:hypothetical protein
VTDEERARQCEECLSEALSRVLGVSDALGDVLWARTPPLPAIEAAIVGLQRARNILVAAGFGEVTT